MKIVHNDINPTRSAVEKPKPKRQQASTWAQREAYKAYKKLLVKYADDIAEIQQEWPGWLPKFNY